MGQDQVRSEERFQLLIVSNQYWDRSSMLRSGVAMVTIRDACGPEPIEAVASRPRDAELWPALNLLGTTAEAFANFDADL